MIGEFLYTRCNYSTLVNDWQLPNLGLGRSGNPNTKAPHRGCLGKVCLSFVVSTCKNSIETLVEQTLTTRHVFQEPSLLFTLHVLDFARMTVSVLTRRYLPSVNVMWLFLCPVVLF